MWFCLNIFNLFQSNDPLQHILVDMGAIDCEDKSGSIIKVRLPIFDSDGWDTFKDQFADVTKTSWNVLRTYPTPIK